MLSYLVVGATGEHRPITVAAWIDEIATTFGDTTARTHRPYWRLLAATHGDRALAQLTTMDLSRSSTPPVNEPGCIDRTRPAGRPVSPASPPSAPSTAGRSTLTRRH